MWKQEIHKLLETNQILFEFVQNQTVFEMLFIPQHQLYLHLIEIKIFQENDLTNNYFQELSDKFNAQNRRIIHLWEDVWVNKKELVQSRILTMIGVFERLNARHCHIERIDLPMAERFLNKNHLQGSVKARFRYGLFLKQQYVEKYLGFSIYDEVESLDGIDFRVSHQEPSSHNPINLLAVATFSGGRLMKVGDRNGQRSYELLRFASLRGFAVIGGLDKLLRAFELEHKPDDIMTYADRDWSNGRSYEMLNFKKIGNTTSQTFMLDNQIFKRYNEKENDKNFLKIFNAGSIKFIKNI
jgi:hypothetical protein